MPTICPHCRAVRSESAQAPDWQCPSCGKAYAKVGGNVAAARTLGTWLLLILASLFLVPATQASIVSARGAHAICASSSNIDSNCSANVKAAASAQLAVTSNLRFPGQYLDAETGLHYNDRRYYDPDTGRYTSRDPLGFEGGINLYAYAGASPSRHTDPTGEIIPCLMMNYARCMVSCVGMEAAEHFLLGCGDMNWGDAAKDCGKSCLLSMLPVPDPCGKFGKLFGAAVGLASGLFNSFPADTLVHTRIQTDTGYQTQFKRIADIQVGDEVLALDELASYDLQTQAKQAASPHNASASSSQTYSNLSASGATSYQNVTQLLNTPERIRTLVHLTLDNGQTLTATDGHPFKTDEGWRDAVLLKKGGKLLLGGGDEDPAQPRYTTIADVRIEQERITTYNLEVAQLHTYLVGVDGVVVHNGHGNSASSTKPQHGYEIFDTITGQIMKPGISGGCINKSGKSQRAQSQVNKHNRNNPGQYDSRVVVQSTPGATRQDMLNWERQRAEDLRAAGEKLPFHTYP